MCSRFPPFGDFFDFLERFDHAAIDQGWPECAASIAMLVPKLFAFFGGFAKKDVTNVDCPVTIEFVDLEGESHFISA
jgi:hypothetical protein